MAYYETEMFAQCVYSLELSYHELMELETRLKLACNATLESHGADFIQFEPLGDTMRVQCVFATYGENLFHEVCKGLAPLLDGKVEARLLFVHKNLDLLTVYTISEKEWKEASLELPSSGPIARSIRERGAAKRPGNS